MATKYLGNNSLLYLLTLIKTKLGEYATTSSVATALANKVDVVSGKGLSTNDYTTDEKNKLAGIADGAQANVIETVKVNGTALTPTDYAVDVSAVTSVNGRTGDITMYAQAAININISQLQEATISCARTYREMRILLNLGCTFIATVTEKPYSGSSLYYALPIKDIGEDSSVIRFGGVIWDSRTSKMRYICIACDGSKSTNQWSIEADEELTNASSIANTYATIIGLNNTYNTLSEDIVALSDKVENNYATTEYVDEAIGGITGLKYEIVDTLPSTGETGTIYLVPKTAETRDIYNEYIWVNSAFELIGTTAPDLSQYVKTSDLVEFTNAEVQTAWENA